MDLNSKNIKPENNNVFLTTLANQAKENLLEITQDVEVQNIATKKANSRRLNDLDSTILEKHAYHDVPDEMLKIEHKIAMLESNLAKLSDELQAIQGIGDETRIRELMIRKNKIETEINGLNKRYSELGISAKISSKLTSAVNFTSNKENSPVKRIKTFIKKQVLSKISPKFGYAQEIKESLEKLSSINTNVDELMHMKTPYGEKKAHYEMLTAYLNKANTIHSQISNDLKNIQ